MCGFAVSLFVLLDFELLSLLLYCCTVGKTKKTIWRCDLELLEIVRGILHYFLTFVKPNNWCRNIKVTKKVMPSYKPNLDCEKNPVQPLCCPHFNMFNSLFSLNVCRKLSWHLHDLLILDRTPPPVSSLHWRQSRQLCFTHASDLLCLLKLCFFYSSAPATPEVLCFMFSGCVHAARPILVNAVSEECLEGISSNLSQMSIWTQGWAD